jgi:hypothetical protein
MNVRDDSSFCRDGAAGSKKSAVSIFLDTHVISRHVSATRRVSIFLIFLDTHVIPVICYSIFLDTHVISRHLSAT